MSEDERYAAIARLAKAFSPGAPIDTQDLFAGRREQLTEVLTAVGSRGRHVVIFGERGVGKTSLAKILVDVARAAGMTGMETGTLNCATDDSFDSVWRKVFRDIVVTSSETAMGFQGETREMSVSMGALMDLFAPDKDVSPDDVRQALTRLGESIVIVDELDRIEDPQFSRQMADTIKTLSDHSVPTTVVLVGVADSVDELIAEHRSIERSLSQVHMPRMSPPELRAILDKAYTTVGMTVSTEAADRIASLSRGLPHFTHLLGQQAGISAVGADRQEVELSDVAFALGPAIRDTAQSIQRSYHNATFSPRQKTLYPSVLLACALVPTDELGYFAASDLKAPLSKIMGREMDIPAFAKHLNEFSSDTRGNVLQKVGTQRRFRYRFVNPLLQPYVILKGVEEGSVDEDLLAQSEYGRPR